MKYFIDTEFIDDGKTIDLISIGILADDGREYYAISKEFNLDNASLWVIENVIPHLPQPELKTTRQMGPLAPGWKAEIIYPPEYKTRAEIREDIREFVNDYTEQPEFWSYYGAYDWVGLCQLFGKMIDLPRGWPGYCRDIKQLCDSLGNPELPHAFEDEHHALSDARWNKAAFKHLMELKRHKA